MEGTRPVLVEVQALAAKSGYGTPQRVATGLDPQAARGAAGGARASGADLVRRPRRLRAGHGRRPADRAGGRSRRGGGAAQQPATTGPRRRTSSSSARSAWAARSGPAARSSGGSPRRPGSASAACSAPPAARHRSPASRWSGSTTSSSWCARLPRDVGVVVVAAGAGSRLGGEVPKQFLPDRRRSRAAASPPAVSPAIPMSPSVVVVLAARRTQSSPPAFLAPLVGSGLDDRSRRSRARRFGSPPGFAPCPADCADRAGARRREAVRGAQA